MDWLRTLRPARLAFVNPGGAALGNLAGILAIVTGAIAAIFSPRLVSGSPQFSAGAAGLVLGLGALATALFVAGCAKLLREIRGQPSAGESDAATIAHHVRIETLTGAAHDAGPGDVTLSYAPRERFILSLPVAALALAAVGLVLELAELVDVLPSRVIPLALALVIAFGAFMVVRRLQRRLALARATSLFAGPEGRGG